MKTTRQLWLYKPLHTKTSPSPLVGEGRGGVLGKRGGVRKARLGRDLTLIIALKIAALITIKLIWFSDAPDVTRADLARAVLEPPVQRPMDQR